MTIPYRTQQFLKRLGIALLILAVVGIILWSLWFLWLQRYVVYTREDGAVLNFELSEKPPAGQAAIPPSQDMEIEIYYNEGENQIELGNDLRQMKGYYVTMDMLSVNAAGVWEQIQALPAGTPIMLELKDINGLFYYTTHTGRPSKTAFDVSTVDTLLNNLRNGDYYTIAKVPAFRDREYGLQYTNEGLPVAGGYLWMDEMGCYWLNPGRSTVLKYLMEIAAELQVLGFDEVVFSDFRFPNTDQIVFQGDKNQTLTDAAQYLVDNCTTDIFAISFMGGGEWTYPTGRTRVYRDDVGDPISLMEATQDLPVEDPAVQMVFLTSNPDESFEEYSVLRPIDMAAQDQEKKE